MRGDLSARVTVPCPALDLLAPLQAASQELLDRMRRLNGEYEAKFGFIYLVFASGKNAEQLLSMLESRLANDERDAEFATACGELLRIGQQRLRNLCVDRQKAVDLGLLSAAPRL